MPTDISPFELLNKLQVQLGSGARSENERKHLANVLNECSSLLYSVGGVQDDHSSQQLAGSIQHLKQQEQTDPFGAQKRVSSELNQSCKLLSRIGAESFKHFARSHSKGSSHIPLRVSSATEDMDDIDGILERVPDFIVGDPLKYNNGDGIVEAMRKHAALRELVLSPRFEPWMGWVWDDANQCKVLLRGCYDSFDLIEFVRNEKLRSNSLFAMWAIGEALSALQDLQNMSTYSLQRIIDVRKFKITVARDKVYLKDLQFEKEMDQCTSEPATQHLNNRSVQLSQSFTQLALALRIPCSSDIVISHRKISSDPIQIGLFHVFWMPLKSPPRKREHDGTGSVSVRVTSMDKASGNNWHHDSTRALNVISDFSGQPTVFADATGRNYIGFRSCELVGEYNIRIQSHNQDDNLSFQVQVVPILDRYDQNFECTSITDLVQSPMFCLAQQLTPHMANEDWRSQTGSS